MFMARQKVMAEIAADARPLVERLIGSLGGARVLIAEGDVVMNEIADRLDPAPARHRVPEKVPRGLGKPIGLAVAAAQEKEQRLLGQVLDSVLLRRGDGRIGGATVPKHSARREADPAAGRHDPGAPIAETVAIARDGHHRVGAETVGKDDVGGAGIAGIVNVQRQYHGVGWGHW
jgi:hypothetical protein